MIVYLNIGTDGTASVECPFCDTPKNVKMPQIDGKGDLKFETRCSCGKTFQVAADKRRHVRKFAELTGGYFHVRREYRGLMTVKNLSLSGARVELNTERRMLRNDQVVLKFNLDDASKTYVEKKARIKRYAGPELGLEFMDPLPDQDPLASYLM